MNRDLGQPDTAGRLAALMLPIVLLVFVGLYVASLLAGREPEIGMLQAGTASIVLAFIGRTAVRILESAPREGPRERTGEPPTTPNADATAGTVESASLGERERLAALQARRQGKE